MLYSPLSNEKKTILLVRNKRCSNESILPFWVEYKTFFSFSRASGSKKYYYKTQWVNDGNAKYFWYNKKKWYFCIWVSLIRPAPIESPRVGIQQGCLVVAVRYNQLTLFLCLYSITIN